jgi:hypothetical protein
MLRREPATGKLTRIENEPTHDSARLLRYGISATVPERTMPVEASNIRKSRDGRASKPSHEKDRVEKIAETQPEPLQITPDAHVAKKRGLIESIAIGLKTGLPVAQQAAKHAYGSRTEKPQPQGRRVLHESWPKDSQQRRPDVDATGEVQDRLPRRIRSFNKTSVVPDHEQDVKKTFRKPRTRRSFSSGAPTTTKSNEDIIKEGANQTVSGPGAFSRDVKADQLLAVIGCKRSFATHSNSYRFSRLRVSNTTRCAW